MRDSIGILNSFTPKHEKEWEARIFIDSAIKQSVEYHLEAIARALSGKYDIIFHTRELEGHTDTRHIRLDNGSFGEVTKNYKYTATMSSFSFYANTRTGIFIEIIKFWTESKTVWPCGGAAHPNTEKGDERKKKETK